MWPLGVALLGVFAVASRANAGTKPNLNARYLTAAQLVPIIEQVKSEIGLNYTDDAILAVCKVESGSYNKQRAAFDRLAYRPEPQLGTNKWGVIASYGVMQVLSSTAMDMGLKDDPKKMYDPYWSIYYGVRYLKWCRDFLVNTQSKQVKVGSKSYPGLTRPPTVAEVLMCYNGGVGNFLRNKNGTPATRQYVARYQEALNIVNRGLA